MAHGNGRVPKKAGQDGCEGGGNGRSDQARGVIHASHESPGSVESARAGGERSADEQCKASPSVDVVLSLKDKRLADEAILRAVDAAVEWMDLTDDEISIGDRIRRAKNALSEMAAHSHGEALRRGNHLDDVSGEFFTRQSLPDDHWIKESAEDADPEPTFIRDGNQLHLRADSPSSDVRNGVRGVIRHVLRRTRGRGQWIKIDPDALCVEIEHALFGSWND